MKHIDRFDEKMTWKQFLVGLSIYVGTTHIMKDVKLYNMYHQINSPASNPKEEEIGLIESIREKVISNVQSSDLFNKFGKKYVIDSLKKVAFKVVNSRDYYSNIDKISMACYINLPSFKATSIESPLLSEPSMDNLIVINRDFIKKDDYPQILTHEIYHYLDKLLAKNGSRYLSNEIDMSQFIDLKIKDKDYAIKKFLLINCFDIKNHPNDIIYQYGNDWYKMKKDEISYYGSDVELFARWKTFRTKLIEMRYTKDGKSITLDDISNYIISKSTDGDDIELLYIINLSKIDEIENIIK